MVEIAMKICKYIMLALLVLYLIAASVRTEWLWFDPGEVKFTDAAIGEAPRLIFSRTIHRKTMVAYSTVTRNAVTGNIYCEGKNGPFEYMQKNGPVVERDLVWWSAGNQACARLPAGTYVTHTTWTLPTPMRALLPSWARGTVIDRALPPKTVTRDSPAFRIE